MRPFSGSNRICSTCNRLKMSSFGDHPAPAVCDTEEEMSPESRTKYDGTLNQRERFFLTVRRHVHFSSSVPVEGRVQGKGVCSRKFGPGNGGQGTGSRERVASSSTLLSARAGWATTQLAHRGLSPKLAFHLFCKVCHMSNTSGHKPITCTSSRCGWSTSNGNPWRPRWTAQRQHRRGPRPARAPEVRAALAQSFENLGLVATWPVVSSGAHAVARSCCASGRAESGQTAQVHECQHLHRMEPTARSRPQRGLSLSPLRWLCAVLLLREVQALAQVARRRDVLFCAPREAASGLAFQRWEHLGKCGNLHEKTGARKQNCIAETFASHFLASSRPRFCNSACSRQNLQWKNLFLPCLWRTHNPPEHHRRSRRHCANWSLKLHKPPAIASSPPLPYSSTPIDSEQKSAFFVSMPRSPCPANLSIGDQSSDFDAVHWVQASPKFHRDLVVEAPPALASNPESYFRLSPRPCPATSLWTC